jgi:hypothetical protein
VPIPTKSRLRILFSGRRVKRAAHRRSRCNYSAAMA